MCASSILFYFILFLDVYFLVRERRKGVYLCGEGSGEDLGGTGEGEIIIVIYCIGKYIFNKKTK